MDKINIFWFRRDLRLRDNAGLYRALRSGTPVLPLFIFDRNILDELPEPSDTRVEFIHDELEKMKGELEEMGASMIIRYGKPLDIWKKLVKEYAIEAVYTNRDFEPYAKERDAAVAKLLDKDSIAFHTFKDHVIFAEDEVVKDDGDPYVVFTPYSRKWLAKLDSRLSNYTNEEGKTERISFYLKPYPNEKYFDHFHQTKALPMPSLEDMGFRPSDQKIPDEEVPRSLIKNYADTRNFPGRTGTTRLSIHFRFGTISIRQKALRARKLSQTFLSELIWRDFYAMILDHFPHVAEGPFREKYKNIQWRNNEEEFKRWCAGTTGYPIVDAGMRELNQSGFMHNRVRMITASFLTKHLLIDWRWGEAYFADKLQDYDLASNNGGWQWAAGSGTDAAPYFRIFNPTSQQKKFDKDFTYIKQWVPEFGTDDYPDPIVDHKEARERCLRVYKEGLDRG